MIDPNILLQSRPAQIQPALEANLQAQSLRNLGTQNQLQRGALAMQPGELDAQRMQNEQTQNDLNDQGSLRKAYLDANGDLTQTKALATKYGASPKALMALDAATVERQTKLAGLDKQTLENHAAANDQLSSLLAPALSEADPVKQKSLFDGAIQTAVQNKLMTPQDAAQHVYTGPDGVKIYAAGLQTDKSITANAALMGAQARQTDAQNNTTKTNLQVKADKLQELTKALSTNDPVAYAQAYGAASADPLVKSNPELLARYDAPAQFNPQTSPVKAQRAALTAEQVTTADQAAANATETKARDASTAHHQGIDEGLRRAQINIEAGNAQVNRAAADPWGTLGINPHPIGGGAAGGLTGAAFLATLPPQMAATVKAVAEGRQTNLPRGGKELDQLMGAVNQYDSTYSVQRAQTRTAFQTGKQGQNIGNLNTAVVHLDQYHEVMKAQNNGTFVPGNQIYNWVASKLGKAAVTNPDFVRQSLAGEAANALKGNATDPEIAGLMQTLGKNQSPEQQEGTALEGLRILGTKLNTYDEQYHQLNQDDPWSPVLPTARAVFSRYKIQPLTRTGTAPEGAPAAAPAPHGIPDLGSTFNGGKVMKVTRIN